MKPSTSLLVNANPVGQHCALYDLKEIGASSPVMMSDHQSRDGLNGFEQKLVLSDVHFRFVPPSQAGRAPFRRRRSLWL